MLDFIIRHGSLFQYPGTPNSTSVGGTTPVCNQTAVGFNNY